MQDKTDNQAPANDSAGMRRHCSGGAGAAEREHGGGARGGQVETVEQPEVAQNLGSVEVAAGDGHGVVVFVVLQHLDAEHGWPSDGPDLQPCGRRLGRPSANVRLPDPSHVLRVTNSVCSLLLHGGVSQSGLSIAKSVLTMDSNTT